MAKLGSYYALCPIIDTKSILGVTEDAEKGFVIVTLDKNIASKYKLSDQKQMVCWRTREKFSSPVLYERTLSKYVAVFNQSYIKAWDAEENLDKVKKYKFNQQIHTIFSNSDNTYIVFQNGSVYKLEDVLNERKSLHPKHVFEGEIVDVLYKNLKDSLYVGLMVQQSNEYHLYWTVLNDGKQTSFNKMDLNKEELSIRGWAFHMGQDRINFLSCWSDQSVFSTILDENEAQNTIGDLFTVIESASMKHRVSLMSLDENYIALFGGSSNEEGAVLLLYNTQFKVTQTKQPFKLFNENARIWLCDNNLILPVGQNLAVIPFFLETEQLAALIGSHKALNDRLDADINIVTEVQVSSWELEFKAEEKDLPKVLQAKMNMYIDQGYPESLVLEELLPDILSNNDVEMLDVCLQFFSDIPEKYLANILQYLMNADWKVFKFKKCSFDVPATLQPLQRIKLINKILSMPYSETILLPYLKSLLSLKDLKPLLEYICIVWESDEFLLPNLNAVETEKKLIEWSCVLIDANYQKIVLSKDQEILKVFYKLRKLIDEGLACARECQQLEPILRMLIRGKYHQKDLSCNLRYSIEQLSLY